MLEIFSYSFMIRASIAGLVIGVIAPIIGAFLVVRRFSLLADTLAHVSLVGVALGLLLRIPVVITATMAAVAAAIGIDRIRSQRQIGGESVLAIFLSGSLALAVVLISTVKGLSVDLLSYLFGSITTVTSQDIVLISGFGVAVLFVVIFLYKELFTVSFDESLARATGLPVSFYNVLLAALAGVTVALAMPTVGVLLIGALMIIPVITAFQFRKSFRASLVLAVSFSLLAVIVGLFASFYLDLPSGASIVLTSLSIFGISLLFSPRQ